MRIGAWNCRGAFARYGDTALSELAPDVLVVPEATASALANRDGWLFEHQPHLSKGTGILIRRGWSVEPVDPPDRVAREWLRPVRLTPPHPGLPSFVLLAFWALGSVRERLPSYAAQFSAVLDTWSEVIAREPTVIAGDFNASASSRSPTHLRNVAMAESLGLASAYHEFNQLDHGEEKEMTLRWIGRGKVERRYHCDFVFVPARWVGAIQGVNVGEWSDWIVAGRSDHAPVMVELSDEALRLLARSTG